MFTQGRPERKYKVFNGYLKDTALKGKYFRWKGSSHKDCQFPICRN